MRDEIRFYRLRQGRDKSVTVALDSLARLAGSQFRPGNPRGVVRAGLLVRIRVAAAFRVVVVTRMPARRRLALLADVPDGERRDGPSELVVRREYSWLVAKLRAVPALPRRRHEIREPAQERKR